MEIGLGRGNANQQLCRFLFESWKKYDMEMASISGGGLANAIPREAWAIVGISTGKEEEFAKDVAEFSDMIHTEYLLAEGNDFTFDATPVETCKNNKKGSFRWSNSSLL